MKLALYLIVLLVLADISMAKDSKMSKESKESHENGGSKEPEGSHELGRSNEPKEFDLSEKEPEENKGSNEPEVPKEEPEEPKVPGSGEYGSHHSSWEKIHAVQNNPLPDHTTSESHEVCNYNTHITRNLLETSKVEEKKREIEDLSGFTEDEHVQCLRLDQVVGKIYTTYCTSDLSVVGKKYKFERHAGSTFLHIEKYTCKTTTTNQKNTTYSNHTNTTNTTVVHTTKHCHTTVQTYEVFQNPQNKSLILMESGVDSNGDVYAMTHNLAVMKADKTNEAIAFIHYKKNGKSGNPKVYVVGNDDVLCRKKSTSFCLKCEMQKMAGYVYTVNQAYMTEVTRMCY